MRDTTLALVLLQNGGSLTLTYNPTLLFHYEVQLWTAWGANVWVESYHDRDSAQMRFDRVQLEEGVNDGFFR